jgi:replicative DNA helicase
LLVDLENDHRSSIHLDSGAVDPTSLPGMFGVALARRAGWCFDDWLRVWSRPRGIDLRDRADRQALGAVLDDQHPDLVAAGPVYRMARRQGRETDEDMTAAVTDALDDLRDRYEFALCLEAHAPHRSAGTTQRDLRPVGSSVWLRWPDLGRTLRPIKGTSNLTIGRFRGDRYPVTWPDELHRSLADPWPWTGVYHAGIPATANLLEEF